MIVVRNPFLCTVFFLFLPLFSADVVIYKEILLENFETSSFSTENIKSRLEKGTPLPEISLSSNFTAPIPGSQKSLVIRIPKKANFPFFLSFPEPIVLTQFVKEIRVPVYSSQSNGSLSLVIETQNFETKQIPIASLNFRGWKECSISLPHFLDQGDRVFLEKSHLTITGIYYLPREDNPTNQEVLLALDDMTALVRDKYRPLRKKEQLLEE